MLITIALLWFICGLAFYIFGTCHKDENGITMMQSVEMKHYGDRKQSFGEKLLVRSIVFIYTIVVAPMLLFSFIRRLVKALIFHD